MVPAHAECPPRSRQARDPARRPDSGAGQSAAPLGSRSGSFGALRKFMMQDWFSRRARHIAWAMALLAAFVAAGSASAEAPGSPPPDYSQGSAWLCRPGQETICTSDLDAMVVGPDGSKTP